MRKKKWGVPWLGQEFKVGDLSPACLGTQSSSRATKLKHYHHLLTLHSVSLYLALIRFNERFNKTALPDQIKLLLSSELNPGSLLSYAGTNRYSPFCESPPASLLALAFIRPPSPPPPSSCQFLLMSALSNSAQA